MCEPATIAIVAGGGAQVAGAGLGAYAQYRQGVFESQVAENNAKLAEMQAQEARVAGVQDAGAIRAEGRRAASAARAAIGASGIDANEGSAFGAQATSAINAEIDATRAISNAARAAWGFKNEAQDQRFRGRAAKQAGILGAASTLLGGLGSAASSMGSAAYKGK